MDNEITIALIGVGATIAGTVLGWMLNNLSNRGKLNIFVFSWNDSFEHTNSIGAMVPCSKREEVQCYTYEVSFDLYNSSGNTKIMRNIQIVFTDGKDDIEKHTPKDDATKRYSHPMVFYDDVEPINIPPKAVIKLDLHNGAWDKDGELDFIYSSTNTVKSNIALSKPLGSAYSRLMEMPGLEAAKKTIDRALNFYKAQKLFKDKSVSFDRPSMHMVFTGNPGTAKTTVARLFSEIMKENGILSKGELYEVGRADIVGKYVGHTAPLVKSAFKRAQGSILFATIRAVFTAMKQ